MSDGHAEVGYLLGMAKTRSGESDLLRPSANLNCLGLARWPVVAKHQLLQSKQGRFNPIQATFERAHVNGKISTV